MQKPDYVEFGEEYFYHKANVRRPVVYLDSFPKAKDSKVALGY